MFYDNLKTICNIKGLKLTPLVVECGGSKGIISGWKKGASPNSDIVARLATRLNVSTDLLIYGEDINNLSPDEIELVEYYRTVDNNSKALIRERAATLSEQSKNKT